LRIGVRGQRIDVRRTPRRYKRGEKRKYVKGRIEGGKKREDGGRGEGGLREEGRL
jgi:hypothetical protein